MSEIETMTAVRLVSHFWHRTLSPVEVMRAVLDRIALCNARVNCFREIDEVGALAAAREAEQRWRSNTPRGLLDGVPVSVKDMIATHGMDTLHGSLTVAPDAAHAGAHGAAHVAGVADAPAVARLRGAGAIIFGKTTTSEFGNKIVTDSPLTGVTRNPWDTRRSCGGSSGGSAVAVALGLGPLSLATDGGGSIRIPACWNGVVGFKPSFNRVLTGPESSFACLSTVGPIARSVEDAALMLSVMTRPDKRDGRARLAGQPCDRQCDYRVGLHGGIAGLRVAFSPDLGLASVEPSIAVCVARAVGLLEALGARIEEVDVPPLKGYLDSGMHSIQWAVLFAQRVRSLSPEQRALVDPDVRELALAGERVSTTTLVDALSARHALMQGMSRFFDEYDLLVTPTFHVGPPPVPGLPAALRMAPPLTSWCNQTGQPAASIPCGLTDEGLPTGLQFIGPREADALVLRACRAYEAARGTFVLPPLASAGTDRPTLREGRP
ncbi:amidase family protein [Paraburkholderia sp. BL10I2N1]|uniref:amidase family protein n=1 Tax=Paraburkholderia sp. BL10I2N1 TaxID=1938796 RepID=UPI00105C39DE|nr:amidase family protein [Paraburkholderia sp. BL10I2N1]TDN67148.1 aspartyl-tRNA(Asn)/glutamyl-tRNA(Gln) amidotransferase subunit A [Paraburkholderia sp. BL10I2N1]